MICLKALELFGFKSFADRTRFEFPQGVTAVVGPNGSGKSNVVDALKWVLGEQSARSLRGKEMTDVIFAGTATRKPLNMAEVALVFDNASRELPLPTDDVQIMRRVYRNGESEYLINGETARLKDIRDLFSGTGAATQAYSVIEQGRVDALLVASGRDRRIVFEEAAGITRFRARRAEALRRLERAEQNRQRLADIVGEVSGRLDTVRNQATRARRWRSLSDRLRNLRVVAATRDLTGVDAQVAAVGEALAGDRVALVTAETEAAAAAAELASLAESMASFQPRVAALRTEANAARQKEAAAAATLESQRSRRDEIEADVRRATADVARARHDARTADDNVAAAEAAVQTAVETVASLDARLSDCRHAAAGSHEDATAAREALAQATAIRDELREKKLRLESTEDAMGSRLAEANEAVTEARDSLDAARGKRAALTEARAAGEGHLQSLAARLAAATRESLATEEAHRAATQRLQAAWGTLADGRAAAEACRERRDVLQEMLERQEGVSDAARRLLLDDASPVPGLAGMVADRIEASVEWAAVVDLALGRRGQAIHVASLTEVMNWYGEKASRDHGPDRPEAEGRIGFLDAASLPEPDAAYDASGHSGVIGRLDQLLTDATGAARDTDTDIVRRLLGHVWIVEAIGIAVPLITGAPSGTLFMTRSGDSLSAADGFETGGTGSTAGLVSRRSELREVNRRVTELAAVVAEATAAVTAREGDVAVAAESVSTARSRRQEAHDALTTARAELDRTGRDERAADTAIAAAEGRLRETERRAVAAEAASRAARSDLDDASSALATADAELHACRCAIDALERSRGEVIEEVHRLQLERATCSERLDRLREAVRASHTAVATCRGDIDTAHAAHAATVGRMRAWELEWLVAGARWSAAAWFAERAEAVLAVVEHEAAGVEAARHRCERVRDAARDSGAFLADQIHARELEEGEARHHRARIVERIRDEYDLDIDAVAVADAGPSAPAVETDADPEPVPDDREALETLIEQLRRKISTMGNVNLEALAEAEELAGRLATLEAQLADVTSAREAIEELIARIDGESRRLLGETLETVRGHFRELFERVFGGGQADLVLEPGVDLLETSVEIVARPPGKEPRNISLLSGGEKTMTCVALLLAIFRSSPSPFCVLDEVDAALDEANVDRFVGVLRDFLSATQFIVVTHSKKTMAAAGTLYGVTMEEPGVSKRIAVRFEAAAAAVTVATRSRAA
jgi:chromosome segregation protein